MYKLTEYAIKILKSDKITRRKVAYAMNNGEAAIYRSIDRTDGASIATNIDAMQALSEITGYSILELRERVIEPIAMGNTHVNPYGNGGSNLPHGFVED